MDQSYLSTITADPRDGCGAAIKCASWAHLAESAVFCEEVSSEEESHGSPYSELVGGRPSSVWKPRVHLCCWSRWVRDHVVSVFLEDGRDFHYESHARIVWGCALAWPKGVCMRLPRRLCVKELLCLGSWCLLFGSCIAALRACCHMSRHAMHAHTHIHITTHRLVVASLACSLYRCFTLNSVRFFSLDVLLCGLSKA